MVNGFQRNIQHIRCGSWKETFEGGTNQKTTGTVAVLFQLTLYEAYAI